MMIAEDQESNWEEAEAGKGAGKRHGQWWQVNLFIFNDYQRDDQEPWKFDVPQLTQDKNMRFGGKCPKCLTPPTHFYRLGSTQNLAIIFRKDSLSAFPCQFWQYSWISYNYYHFNIIVCRNCSSSLRVQQLKSELEAGLDLWRKQAYFHNYDAYHDKSDNYDANHDNYDDDNHDGQFQ